MGKFHSFAAPQENPVLSALDPSACYLIQFMLEDGKFGVQLVYYDSILELYCAICFVTPAAMEGRKTAASSDRPLFQKRSSPGNLTINSTE